jgi:hypothetical protein
VDINFKFFRRNPLVGVGVVKPIKISNLIPDILEDEEEQLDRAI